MVNVFSFFEKKKVRPVMSWAELEPVLAPFKRNAWVPEVITRVSSTTASKYSGIPVLQASEEWPCCHNCKQAMQLFVQINSEQLPTELGRPFDEGYLQVFYCTNAEKLCEVECEAFFPFSKSTLVRVVGADTPTTHRYTNSPVKDAFPEQEIVGWYAKQDYPNGDELEVLGCALSDQQSDALQEQGYPLAKDKMLGWPCWVQGVEYPECPICSQAMALIFQIDSDDKLPYMFGDVGCSHITQCKQHKDIMAIAWACG